MADVVSGGGAPQKPQSLGEKLAFSFPAMLVTFVFAMAIFIIVNHSTRKELAVLSEQISELRTDFGKMQSELKDSTTKVTATQQKTDALVKDSKELETSLSKTTVQVVEAKLRLDNLDKNIAETTKTTTKHETVLAQHGEKLHYVEERLKKLAGIENDVLSLKSDTAGLKDEYKKLTGDLNAMKTQANVTEKDLADLGERAKQFQMRVLLARAREASEAARSGDIKSLLQHFEDVEGGK